MERILVEVLDAEEFDVVRILDEAELERFHLVKERGCEGKETN